MFYVGLDLGQSNDYTVLTIVEEIESKYIIRAIRRYSLGIDYPSMVESVSCICAMKEISGKFMLIADATGVGRPVMDLLISKSIPLVCATIASGAKANWRGSNVAIPKQELVSSLQVAVQSGRLIIPRDLEGIKELFTELVHFKAKMKSGGNVTFEAAKESIHDDMVISLALAIWYGEYMTMRGKQVRIIGGN